MPIHIPIVLMDDQDAFLRVLIVVLLMNLLFWIIVICWRVFFMEGIILSTRRYFRTLRALFSSSSDEVSLLFNRYFRDSFSNHSTFQTNCDMENGESTSRTVDLPPPYEGNLSDEYIIYSIKVISRINTFTARPLQKLSNILQSPRYFQQLR